jgi:hypothetical protein
MSPTGPGSATGHHPGGTPAHPGHRPAAEANTRPGRTGQPHPQAPPDLQAPAGRPHQDHPAGPPAPALWSQPQVAPAVPLGRARSSPLRVGLATRLARGPGTAASRVRLAVPAGQAAPGSARAPQCGPGVPSRPAPDPEPPGYALRTAPAPATPAHPSPESTPRCPASSPRQPTGQRGGTPGGSTGTRRRSHRPGIAGPPAATGIRGGGPGCAVCSSRRPPELLHQQPQPGRLKALRRQVRPNRGQVGAQFLALLL